MTKFRRRNYSEKLPRVVDTWIDEEISQSTEYRIVKREMRGEIEHVLERAIKDSIGEKAWVHNRASGAFDNDDRILFDRIESLATERARAAEAARKIPGGEL